MAEIIDFERERREIAFLDQTLKEAIHEQCAILHEALDNTPRDFRQRGLCWWPNALIERFRRHQTKVLEDAEQAERDGVKPEFVELLRMCAADLIEDPL